MIGGNLIITIVQSVDSQLITRCLWVSTLRFLEAAAAKVRVTDCLLKSDLLRLIFLELQCEDLLIFTVWFNSDVGAAGTKQTST